MEVDRLLQDHNMAGLVAMVRSARVEFLPERRILLLYGEDCTGAEAVLSLRNLTSEEASALLSQE